MKNIKAFTLIEMTAVIIILLIILGITVPLLNKGSSHHEAKMVSQSIQSIINLGNQLARSSGKVYIADFDLSTNLYSKDTVQYYRFNKLKIYSMDYDRISGDILPVFTNESFEVPISIAAYVNLSASEKDYIYFKPDGSVAANSSISTIVKLLTFPDDKPEMFYSLSINKSTGTTEIVSYIDE